MQDHDVSGTVVLIGTLAEEGGGGKIKLLEAGVFGQGGIGPSLTRLRVVMDFQGKPAHAAAAPWEGRNALDAAVGAYVNISTLRQQLRPTTRIQGVISNDGGTAPNIIPADSQIIYAIRAAKASAVETTMKKIIDCVEGAARMAQCTVKMEFSDMYRDLVNDKALAYEYASFMDRLHEYKVRTVFDPANGIGASTDFGNVTYALPACHPGYGIPTVQKVATIRQNLLLRLRLQKRTKRRGKQVSPWRLSVREDFEADQKRMTAES
ncbi:hypothetical protein IAT40_004239 [Kwoniella sp. CBS 6097]